MSYNSYKFVLAGDTNVGKTELADQLINHTFKENFTPTIGAQFYLFRENNKNQDIQIWDTSGQEKFRSLLTMYCKNSLGALLVFDLTQRSSFDGLSRWIDDLKSWCKQNAFIVLVGNKKDLEIERQVTEAEAREFAKRYNLPYFETSSKTGENVKEAFSRLVQGDQHNVKEDEPKVNKSNDKNFILELKNFQRIPFDRYKEQFKFIVGDKEYVTSRVVADLLSPIICQYHFHDETITKFEIRSESSEDYFEEFLKLSNFEENSEVDEKHILIFIEYFLQLGNIDECEKLLQLKSEKPQISDLIQYLKIFKSNNFYDHLEIDWSMIDECAQRFTEISLEELKMLDFDTIEQILSSNSLQLADEDSLVKLIINLTNEDKKYSSLFEYVYFKNVKEETLEEFVSEFDFNFLTGGTWKSICSLFLPKMQQKIPNGRYKEKEIELVQAEPT